jgi:ABC-2 type transport system permease protein
MTAIVAPTQGFRPFAAKELLDWWKRRAALITALAVSALGGIGTLATRIDELAGGVPSPAMLEPTSNVLGGQFDQWVVLAAIFGSIGLLVGERSSGTLAWTLSKPIARPALLVAKWLAAVAVLAVVAVVVPLSVSVAVATWAYGAVPDLPTVARFGVLLLAVAAFIVALDLALATKLDSVAGIAAIALAVFATPYLLGSIAPSIAAWWPTAIGATAGAVASGAPLEPASIAGWAIGLLAAGIAGVLIFSREDL